MRLSFITPTAFIKEFGTQSDFILALSHLINLDTETAYECEIKATGLEIILDNGLFENETPEPLESLVKKAVKIGASTVFSPDMLYDAVGTQKSLESAILAVQGTGVKLGAVVQADNALDYLEQLMDFNANPDVSLVGLSILAIPKSFGGKITNSRIKLLKKMRQLEKQGVKWKNCHLLGLGDSMRDVLYAKKYCPWVVSNDSSCAFQSGLFGKKLNWKLEVKGGKVKEKVNFDLQEVNEEQKKLIQSNITKIKNKVCK